MILIFEMTWTGTQHAPGNSATIRIIARAAPDQTIHVFAEKSHLDELRGDSVLSSLPGIGFHPIDIAEQYREKPHIVSGRRGLHELRTLSRALRLVPRYEPCLLVLLSATSSAIFAASLLCRTSRRRIGVQVVLHGNLNDVTDWRSRNPLIRAFDMASALAARHGPALRFLVLEEAIRQGMQQVAPRAAAVTDVLPHPINRAEAPDAPTAAFALPLRIGLVGQATEAKGITPFLELARELKARHGDKLTFHVLGRAPPGSDLTRFSVLAEPISHDYLDRAEFRRRLGRLHFVCLPLQERYYGLSASGALLDAITWLKPIIGARLPLIEQVFDQFGDLGYLCDGPAAMLETIETIVSTMDARHYERQVQTLAQARLARAPDALASDYRAILRVGFNDFLNST